jgi:hypothetical protein
MAALVASVPSAGRLHEKEEGPLRESRGPS